ncbi:hypothetical protein B0H14DRAFT_3579984 [Mycena olivaceomarginata]|nr:hypothetical protein B0H14DRAFT_3579984 [Mycena olivaceomarginata]
MRNMAETIKKAQNGEKKNGRALCSAKSCKGTFKDHLVGWEGDYLENEHGKSKAKKIMADIDQRSISPRSKAMSPLRCCAPSALVRRNVVDEVTLDAIDTALARYHRERVIFVDHYRHLIQEFGAPNGLCSLITESKHTKAMLTINDRLDKLAATRVDFTARAGPNARPLPTPALPPPAEDEDESLGKFSGNAQVPPGRNPAALAQYLDLPELIPLLQRFLYLQDHPDHDHNIPLSDVPLGDCPDAPRRVTVFPSAVAKFYAPSDQSGIRGMLHERIRAVRSWRGGAARYDCVFVEGNLDLPGFRGLLAARVLLFMSFKHGGITYPCALVTWFSAIGGEPCPDVGMWMVEPDVDRRGRRVMDIIHIAQCTSHRYLR